MLESSVDSSSWEIVAISTNPISVAHRLHINQTKSYTIYFKSALFKDRVNETSNCNELPIESLSGMGSIDPPIRSIFFVVFSCTLFITFFLFAIQRRAEKFLIFDPMGM